MTETVMFEITLRPSNALILWLFGLVALVAIAALFLLKFRHWLRRHQHDPRDRQKVREQWQKIAAMRQSDDPHQLELAVVRADQLLDQVLKSMFIPGNTLGERLKAAQHKYPELKNVWWAHKVRNDIVHEQFGLALPKLRRALKEFERALRRIGAL